MKRQGDRAIEKWIADQMAHKTAVVVLVGARTASRPWVRHEIAYAWDNDKPLVGVRIHGLADLNRNTDSSGANPFALVNLERGGSVGDHVPIFDPSGSNSQAVYADIKANLTTWVGNAYRRS